MQIANKQCGGVLKKQNVDSQECKQIENYPIENKKITRKDYRKCSNKRPGRLFKILTFRVGAYSRGAVNREGRLLKNLKFEQGKRIFFRNCNDHKIHAFL